MGMRWLVSTETSVQILMTPEAIEKATTMARECMNSNYKKCGR